MNDKFICNLCSSVLPSDKKLRDHKRNVHYKKSGDVYSYVLLKEVKSSTVSNSNVNFKCEKYNATYGKQNYLAQHIRENHEKKHENSTNSGSSNSFSLEQNSMKQFCQAYSLKETKQTKYNLDKYFTVNQVRNCSFRDINSYNNNLLINLLILGKP